MQETTEVNIVHQFNNDNDKNKALIGLYVKTGQLETTEKHTLDFDNVVFENKKQDAKKSHRNTNGFHPNFYFLRSLPVHIENHNANTPAKYKQLDTIKICFNVLKYNCLYVKLSKRLSILSKRSDQIS